MSDQQQQMGGIVDGGGSVPLAVERASDFELPDQEGNAWGLADHLANGPVLLVFYRGDW
jgi:hypothetical protein